MECLAHRGFGGVNPENTLAAVEAAIAAGADGIELDVRRCGSGEPVVVHDETVDRVTSASGPVAEFSASELAALSVLGSGEGVPTVEAVCRATPPSVRLNLELKERGLAAEVVELARQHDCDLLVSSRSAAALAEIEGVPRGYIFHDAPDLLLKEAGDLGCTAVHPHWHLCTDSFLATARERGFAVNAWTVTSRAVAADLVVAGVDGLIADAPTYCQSTESSRP
jgi:glycerophosphoryl diester phosphodiesterase